MKPKPDIGSIQVRSYIAAGAALLAGLNASDNPIPAVIIALLILIFGAIVRFRVTLEWMFEQVTPPDPKKPAGG